MEPVHLGAEMLLCKCNGCTLAIPRPTGDTNTEISAAQGGTINGA